MKKVSLFFMLGILMSVATAYAGDKKTEKFEVLGNCGMCEKRIEKAAGDLEGVTEADWDKETKLLTVSFESSEISLDKIHKAVAKAGHDTEKSKADDEVYSSLPGCCKYEREEK